MSEPIHSKSNPAESDDSPDTTPEPNSSVSEGEDLQQLQADMEKFRELALRSQADLDNYRKRAQREKEESNRYANAGLLGQLIPIIDNFDFGLAAASSDPAGASLTQGMSMVLKQLQDFLAAQGVTAIDAEGQPFDPNLHEAVAQEPSDTVPEGHVLRQVRRGYKLKDRLLRAANVIVSKGPG